MQEREEVAEESLRRQEEMDTEHVVKAWLLSQETLHVRGQKKEKMKADVVGLWILWWKYLVSP